MNNILLGVITALGLALLGAGGWIWLQSVWLDDAEAEARAARADLATCAARITNIREDMESDATVTDPRKFLVPDRWLLPED